MRKNLFPAVVVCVTALMNAGFAQEQSAIDHSRLADGVTAQTIYRQKVDGYINIRIPAICMTAKGTLLAFAEGRVGGDAGKIEIIVRRSTDNGKTWGDQIVVWKDSDNTCGNPTPVVDQTTGTIWLICTWNVGTDPENKIMDGTSSQPRRVYVTCSDDDGMTWSKPVEQPQLRKDNWGWYATGPCNAIQLTRGPHKGRMVIPANHSIVSETVDGVNRYRSHLVYSDDHGKTWQLGGIDEPLTNESTVVELEDGSVMQNMRSYHGKGGRAVAISKDGGKTLEKMLLDETLRSPVCQGSILRYRFAENGEPGVILFSAPYGEKREKMSVWASFDDGKTWPVRRRIFDGPAAYSNLVALPDGQVGLLCELGNDNPYRTITFVTFPLAWLKHCNETDIDTEPGARATGRK